MLRRSDGLNVERRSPVRRRKPRQPRRQRSARLKSIPVETSARSVVGLRATPRSTLRRSISPFGLIALFASAGRARLAGSRDDAQRGEGQPGLGRIGRRDMALHVDRRSPRLRVQRGLAGRCRDHLFDPGKAATDHAPAAQAPRWRSFPRSGQARPESGYRRPEPRSRPRCRPISATDRARRRRRKR